jgi:hypothetical protein
MSIFSRLFQKEEGAAPARDGEEPGVLPEGTIEDPSDQTTPNAVMPEPPPRATVERGVTQLYRDPPSSPPAGTPSSPPVRTPPPLKRPAKKAAAALPPPGSANEPTIQDALDKVFPTDGSAPSRPVHGTSSPADEAAARAIFEDLAIAHVRPVRNMMLELRWGDGLGAWLELARPALRSLRKMAEPVGLADLCKGLDAFSAALDSDARSRDPGAAERLLAAYQPLVAALPRAFTLDGDRDRREPLLLQALLRQVPGLEPLMIQRLAAAGLGALEAIMRARADEMAAVAALPMTVAAALATKVQELHAPAAAALETATARRALHARIRALEACHQAFEKASTRWSAESRTAKRRHRRERELAYLPIVVALARAGEVDLVDRLSTLPFARRIEELDRCLRAASTATPA